MTACSENTPIFPKLINNGMILLISTFYNIITIIIIRSHPHLSGLRAGHTPGGDQGGGRGRWGRLMAE